MYIIQYQNHRLYFELLEDDGQYSLTSDPERALHFETKQAAYDYTHYLNVHIGGWFRPTLTYGYWT